jgi:hypothetical protein
MCRMTPIVVDTDVVSFLFKNDSRAQLYLPLLRNHELLVSFTTEAELEQWILLAKWGADRIQRFRAFMTGFVAMPSLDCRNCLALRRLPGHPQSEGLLWRAQSKPPELCLVRVELMQVLPSWCATFIKRRGATGITVIQKAMRFHFESGEKPGCQTQACVSSKEARELGL